MHLPSNVPGPADFRASPIINTSSVSLLLFDVRLRVISASPSFCAHFHIAEDQANGRSLPDLGDGEWDRPELRALLQIALAEGAGSEACEMDLVRPNSGTRHLLLHAQKVAYEDKRNDRVLLAIDDVTDARLTYIETDALLREKDRRLGEFGTLIDEMRHRIANSLQIIANILMLKAQAMPSAESRQHLEDAHDRVLSIALTQQHLQFGLEDVAIRPYLTTLCDGLATSMIRDYRPIVLTVEADDLTVSSHDAVSLGLVAADLVINATKHAFPDARAGKVAVRYRADRESWRLSVSDDGVGLSEAARDSAGLGTSLLEALARQLDARVEYADARPGLTVGLVCNETKEQARSERAFPLRPRAIQ